MSDTFRYRTRPTSDGDHTTTQSDYRGTKTKAELLAEITALIAAFINGSVRSYTYTDQITPSA